MKKICLFFALFALVATMATAQYIAPPDHTVCPGAGPFSMDFSWNVTPNALAYRFTLERFNSVSWVMYADVVNVQTSTQANGLTNGVYRWRVNAIQPGSQPNGWGPYWYLDENPLPVQLASFTGTSVNPTSVRLNWTTVSETNNYGFYVQRKRTTEVSWAELPNNFVAGHGTTLEPHDYSFIDSAVAGGTWQYRLRQVDLNGQQHLSDPIQVALSPTSVGNSEKPLEFTLEQNYPNPFNPSTTIAFTVPQSGPVTLKVYNLLGQEVATLLNEEIVAGTYTIQYDARLASGVYVYRLQSGNHVATQQMTLVK